MKKESAASQSPLQYLMGALSPAEQIEFVQIIDYLTERSDQPSLPEGSLTRVIASASPTVQAAFKTLGDTYDTPRIAPFTPKMSAENYDQSFGFDPQTSALVRQRLEDESVVAGLQRRMGTDADRPQSPPSLRELISAAAEEHSDEQ